MLSKTWENSILQLKQLDGIGIGNARLLSNAGIDSFKKIEERRSTGAYRFLVLKD